jgi:hypothetical protein
MASASDFIDSGVKAGDNLRFVESTIAPVAVTLDVSARISNDAAGIFVGDSGTKMYIADNANNRIDQYTLSTANSLVGATYASKTHSDAQLSGNGLFFRPDGTRVFYIFNSGTLSVKQVTLGTPWDISTGGATATFAINANVGTARGLSFSSDGTKMYVPDDSDGFIEQYTLGTAWDISTASYASKRLRYRYFGTSGNYNILFNTTGTELTIASSSTDGTPFFVYTLSTAWDISTGTFTRSGLSVGTLTTMFGACWSSNGSKIFTISQDLIAREYSVDSAYIASQKITIFSYTGKATLLGLAVKPIPSTSSSYNSLQNSTVYANVDSAGDRLIGNSTFIYQASTGLSLGEPKAFTGCIAKSKTSLVVKAEAREDQIIEARYSIG